MAQVKYVVHGGCVGCSMGSATTKLVGKTNSRIGSQIRILEPDTGTDSFEGNFGICTTLTARNNGIPTTCAMCNIPKWINTNADYISSSAYPGVTMNSFTVCTAGCGLIVPLEDGQTMEDFDYQKFAEGLPKELQALFKGLAPACAFGNDPVNMATGNFIYSKDDIEIPGRFPLVFKRFYNAMDDSDGVIGKNWTHNFNIFLTKDGKNVKITFDDGHLEEYYQRDDGSYIAPLNHLNTLTRSEHGYDLTLPSMEMYCFDNQGRLLSISDVNGNTTDMSYNSGLLSKVSNACGGLHFTYNEQNQLIQIQDHTGRRVTYEYSGSFLIAVKNPTGAVYRYEYGTNGKISNIINPMGVTAIHNEYDGQNRTVKQSFPDGGSAGIKYDDRQQCVTNTEQNGNQVVYVHDDDFRTTQIIYEDSEERFGYNKNNKRSLYIDRNGNTSTYEYDSRGNLTKETDPVGGVTGTEYNEFNRPARITAPNGGVTSFTYDPKGNIIKAVDSLQRTLQFENNGQGLVTKITLPDNSHNQIEYDDRGNILAALDSDGNRTQYEYDHLNRVVKAVDGEGHPTLFEYNGRGDITRITDAAGNTRCYTYNLAGKVTQITDFDGGATQYKYNTLNKVEEIVNQAGGITKFTYDLMWNVTSVTDPNGNTVRYVYDKYQRVIQSIDEEGNITSYEYDPKGNVTAVISALGARTEIKYDALDRRQEITEPDGAVTRLSYDKGGNLATVTDALGNVTKREYDLAGQMTAITDALGNKTTFTYSPLGQVERILDAKGEARAYQYHPGGKLQSVTLPCGESEAYEYNKNGNIIKVTDALGNETALRYDSLGRVAEIINPLLHSKKFGYDAVGNITQITDEKGDITRYRYSLLGDIIEVIDASGHSTKYDYDKAGRLTKLEQYRLIDDTLANVKCPEYQITTYERNKKGEVVSVKSPLGKAVKYGYDKVGNVTSKLDGDGLETLYEYNLAGKLTKVSYADGKTVELGYNVLGQLTAMHDWLGTTKIEVDALGRAEKVTDFEGKEVGYAWNALGQKEKLIYPDGSEVKYEYNPSGRLSKVLSETGMANYTYDPMGRILERILPDSTTTKYEMNPLGRLTSLTHSKDGSILDQFEYTYDPTGNITQIEKHRAGMEADSGVFQYAYDSLGRLVSAARGDDVKRYRYDELGNRVKEWKGQKHDAVDWTTHSYNARNQLIRTQEGEAVKEYRYDGRGNLTNITENGQLKSRFEFDATNRMVGAFTAGEGSAEYTYNGFMNRVKKLENLQNPDAILGMQPDPVREIRYVLDMTLPYDNLLMTEGSQNQSFVWGKGLISACGEEKFYYLQDHLGSPIRLLGENQSDTLAYDEFGVPLASSGKNVNQPFGFTGYQMDEVSELYYAQARYYEPKLGRFGAEDTHWNPENILWGDRPTEGYHDLPLPNYFSTIQSNDLYTYTLNNPLKYKDYTGDNAVEIAKNAWILGGLVSQADSPIPGPADVAGLIIGIGGTIIAGGVAIYEGVQASGRHNSWTEGSSALEIPRGEVIPFPKKQPKKDKNPIPVPVPIPDRKKEEKEVILYRWGGNTPNTFTPRPCDDDTGLSVWTHPGKGNNQVTTLSTLRAQGWNVESDKPGHYLIMPPNPADMPGWQASKANFQNANGDVDSKKNVWNNPDIHPLTNKLHSVFVPISEWGN